MIPDYNVPDRAGFEKLLKSSFTRFGDMVFRKANFSSAAVGKRLRSESVEQVQKETNHTHLILYAPEIDVQRQWAGELRRFWQERFALEFPDLEIRIETEDTGEEIIVTCWASGPKARPN